MLCVCGGGWGWGGNLSSSVYASMQEARDLCPEGSLDLRELIGLTKNNSKPGASLERGFPCQTPRLLQVLQGFGNQVWPVQLGTAENTGVECAKLSVRWKWLAGGWSPLTDAQGSSCCVECAWHPGALGRLHLSGGCVPAYSMRLWIGNTSGFSRQGSAIAERQQWFK